MHRDKTKWRSETHLLPRNSYGAKTKISQSTEVTWQPVFSPFYEHFTHSTVLYCVLISSPNFIPRSVFYTQCVVPVRILIFIPQSLFYTQPRTQARFTVMSLGTSPQYLFNGMVKDCLLAFSAPNCDKTNFMESWKKPFNKLLKRERRLQKNNNYWIWSSMVT